MTLGLNPVPGSARNHDPIEPIEPIDPIDPIEPIEPMVKKNDPEGSFGGLDARPESRFQLLIQKGLKSISGKKWLNSIMMTAVRVNQIAENTGAVVRNFFMVLESRSCGWNERLNRR